MASRSKKSKQHSEHQLFDGEEKGFVLPLKKSDVEKEFAISSFKFKNTKEGLLPSTTEDERTKLTEPLQITRSKFESVEWINCLQRHFTTNKAISRMQRLAESYILDWAYYMANKLPVDSLKIHMAAATERKTNFCSKLPDAEIPTGNLSFASLSPNGLQMNQLPQSWKYTYWFRLLSSHSHLTSYLINPNPSELLLSTSILGCLYDAFWLDYCKNRDNDIQLYWCRGNDIRWACPSLEAGWIVKTDGYLVAKINREFCILAIFEDKALEKQSAEDRCKLAETSRYCIDSLRQFNLSWEQLQQILIPSVHTAGPAVDFYTTNWIYKPEHFYIFQHITAYDIANSRDLIKTAQRLWNIAKIVENNIQIISNATDDPPHIYVLRPHLESSPNTNPDSTQKDPSSGNDQGLINTPNRKLYPPSKLRQLLEAVEKLGFIVLNELKSSSSTIVAQACLKNERKVIKLISKESPELGILEQIGGKNHIISLISSNIIYVDNEELILLELPYIENQEISSDEQLKQFFYQLVETMIFLHAEGIFYRDFKRNNILWDGTHLTLIDFNYSLTKNDFPTKECAGTRGYRAPEVEDPSKMSDLRADVWSIGIVFGYEWLRLHHGNMAARCIFQTDYQELLRDLRTILKAPNDVIDLLAKLLHPEPNKRLAGISILQHNYFGTT